MWRTILARAPLPMLALAASYGVWSFNLLFVPAWVAFVSAAAFEATYVGLAVARVSDHDRKRAALIAASAVAVSVLYNVASGLFHRRPELLDNPPLWLDGALAVMHGLPLAVVAYAVASLLLHAESRREDTAAPATMPTLAYARLADPPHYPMPEMARMPPSPEAGAMPAKASTKATKAFHACPACGGALASAGAYGAAQRWGHCKACKPA